MVRKSDSHGAHDHAPRRDEAGAVVLALGDAAEAARLGALLAEAGHRSTAAPPDADLAAFAADLAPQAFIVDVDGSRDGLAACKQLRHVERFDDVPVLALSAKRDSERLAAVLAAGATDFLIKPVEPVELAARLAVLFHLRDLEADVQRYRTNLKTIIEVYREISATLDPDRIFATIVKQVASVTSAERSSIVLTDRSENAGYVLATWENPDAKDLVISLDNYPEIRKVMETKRSVSVDDLASDPLMDHVRERVSQFAETSVLVVPILSEEEVLGTIFLRASRFGRPFAQEEIDFCNLVAHASVNALRNAHRFRAMQDEKKRLELLSITDQLTNTFNRSYLFLRLQEEFQRAQRYGLPFSYVMIDVDDFKKINDTYGHTVGDRVLNELAEEIRRVMRKSDLLARYGGEEFGILLPSTGLAGAMREAERVRSAIAKLAYSELPAGVRLTVSAGVAAFPHATVHAAEDLIVNADKALYKAKGAGKNRVCQFT
jgi:diguanylate cyclase (GGDEF)-like protein